MPLLVEHKLSFHRKLFGACAICAAIMAAPPTSWAQPTTSLGKKKPPPAIGPAQDQILREIYPDGVSVGPVNHNNIGSGFGELQATVVPPGKKDQCPAGRLLISNDGKKNPGYVVGFDLDALNSSATAATPEALPDPDDRQIASNDHDLLTLSTGDVLLLKMGRSKTQMSPKPDWADHAYKLRQCTPKGELKIGLADANTPVISSDITISKSVRRVIGPAEGECKSVWGANARSVMYVWRSEDCGQTFAYKRAIDMAEVDDGWGSHDDGSGGLPQDVTGFPSGVTSTPGSSAQPVWQMGGTDGPLARVDYATGRVLYTLGVVGRKPVVPKPDDPVQNFILSDSAVRRTAVAMSSDRGDNWTEATSLPFSGWRTDVVALANDKLAFLPNRTVNCTVQDSDEEKEKCYFIFMTDIGANLGASSNKDEGATWQHFDNRPWTKDLTLEKKIITVSGKATGINTNIVRKHLLMRSPDSRGMMLALPEMIGGGFGYGLYFYSYPGGLVLPLPPIAPKNPGKDNFILHLAGIDFGEGPILLYWYDVNAAAMTMQVRGRILTSDHSQTADFNISTLFSTPGSSSWFGDYITAGGFHRRRPAAVTTLQSTGDRLNRSGGVSEKYEFLPVWKQPGGHAYFANVTYTTPPAGSNLGHFRFDAITKTRPAIGPVDFETMTLEVVEEE